MKEPFSTGILNIQIADIKNPITVKTGESIGIGAIQIPILRTRNGINKIIINLNTVIFFIGQYQSSEL